MACTGVGAAHARAAAGSDDGALAAKGLQLAALHNLIWASAILQYRTCCHVFYYSGLLCETPRMHHQAVQLCSPAPQLGKAILRRPAGARLTADRPPIEPFVTNFVCRPCARSKPSF